MKQSELAKDLWPYMRERVQTMVNNGVSTRRLSDDLRWFNVLKFGASARSASSDQSGFEKAIIAADNAGGGVVYVPNVGSLKYTLLYNLQLPSNVWLYSNGAIIDTDGITVAGTGASGEQPGALWARAASNVRVEGLNIEGDGASRVMAFEGCGDVVVAKNRITQTRITYTASTLSFSGDTLSDTGKGLAAFTKATTVTVVGSNSNDGGYAISGVASDGSSITIAGSFATESAGATITLSIEDNVAGILFVDNPANTTTDEDYTDIIVANNMIAQSSSGILFQGLTLPKKTHRRVAIIGNMIDGGNMYMPTKYSSGIKPDKWIYECVVANNIINGANKIRDGINLQEFAYDCVVGENIVKACTRNGVIVEGGQSHGDVENVAVVGNIITDISGANPNNDERHGIVISRGSATIFRNIAVADNIIRHVDGIGIKDNSAGVVNLEIKDNIVDGCGNAADNAQPVYLRSDETKFSGNTIRGTEVIVGLQIQSGSNIYVTDNTLDQVDVSGNAYADGGTDTIIRNNFENGTFVPGILKANVIKTWEVGDWYMLECVLTGQGNASTTLSVAAAATDTVITVASAVGFAATNGIVVVLDDATTHATTINGVAGNQITLASGIPAGKSAAIGNVVRQTSATVTIDTTVDVLDYGTAARGAYLARGTIVCGDSSSNQHRADFNASMRMTDAATVLGQEGIFVSTDNTTLFNAITLDTDLTNIQLKITNAHATISLDNMMLHFTITKTDDL